MLLKDYDKNTIVHRRQYSLSRTITLTIGGLCFFGLSILMFVFCIKIFAEGFQNQNRINTAGFGSLIFGLLLLAITISLIVYGYRDVYHWRKRQYVLECGESGIAVITKIFDVSYSPNTGGRNMDMRYGFVLSYEKDGIQKTFKTNACYDINERNYLVSLENVKIKIRKNYVAIDEEFRYEIYKKDSFSGLDKQFYNQKPFSAVNKLITALIFLSIIIFFILLALTIIVKNNVFLFVGLGVLVLMLTAAMLLYIKYFH